MSPGRWRDCPRSTEEGIRSSSPRRTGRVSRVSSRGRTCGTRLRRCSWTPGTGSRKGSYSVLTLIEFRNGGSAPRCPAPVTPVKDSPTPDRYPPPPLVLVRNRLILDLKPETSFVTEVFPKLEERLRGRRQWTTGVPSLTKEGNLIRGGNFTPLGTKGRTVTESEDTVLLCLH